MTEQISSNSQTNPPKSLTPLRAVMGILVLVGATIVVCAYLVFQVVSTLRNIPTIEATDAKIGTEIRDDGFLVEDNRTISANAEKIYLVFDFGNPANTQVPLEFRWYVGDQLLHAYSSIHEDGYVTAFIVRDPKKLASFPSENYHVEVWFGNTMILSEPFVVK